LHREGIDVSGAVLVCLTVDVKAVLVVCLIVDVGVCL